MKKIAILVLFVLLAAQFVTAGGGQAAPAVPGPASAGKPAHVNLIFTMWGDEPEAMSSVLAEFEKRTADTLNTSIKILWTPQSDYANKLRLMLSAGEQIDSCFDATWITLQDFASRGVYYSLDDYFNNPDYPGLLNFDSEMLHYNMLESATGRHIYAIPLMQTLGNNVYGYMIRKDLREKYGLPPIKSLPDLEKFMDLVLKNEPGMVPMAANQAGGPYQGLILGFDGMKENPDTLFWQVPVASGMFGCAQFAPDKKSVTNFYMVGDPRIVNGKWFSQDMFELTRRWYVNGYVDKDISSKTAADMQNAFTSGRAAILQEGTANYALRKAALLKAVPNAQVEYWVYNEKMGNMEPNAVRTNYLATNYQCIPVTSKNIDRTINFYNWLFLTQDNHDLF